jgi:septum formation protein
VSLAIRELDADGKNSYRIKDFVETTHVYFSSLSTEVVSAYVKSGEPFDKAGGYGIQSLGSSLIERIEGCYFNVVGFPVHRFCKEFLQLLG